MPSVDTNVGNGARILDGAGRLVMAENVEALENGLRKMIELPASERSQWGECGRKIIENRYWLGVTIDAYRKLYAGFTGKG